MRKWAVMTSNRIGILELDSRVPDLGHNIEYSRIRKKWQGFYDLFWAVATPFFVSACCRPVSWP